MSQRTENQVAEMKKQTIGVEVEMNSITREKAARLAATFFGTGRYENTACRNGYCTWSAWDAQGREWKFQKDVSIAGCDAEKCELVTPILKYEDIETLQELVRKLRKAGAISHAGIGAGVHIHIGANGHTPQTLRNLANLMASHERLIADALKIDQGRMNRYCRTVNPQFIEQLNQKKPNRVLGGMLWLKMEKINVGTAIDLSGLGLDTIEETEEQFSIGAMVTLRQLELDAGLAAYTNGAVRESVRHIVGVQLRNLATVGGSIYSRFGFSDVLTLFLALNASVELYKGGIVPLREYAERPYDRDIVVRLLVRKEAADYCYQSVRNSQTDIPVLTCAAARLQDGSYRFAVGARPLKAVLYEEPAAPAQQLAETIQQQVVTGSNMRGSAEYRNHLAGVLVKRAVCQLEG